ANEAVADDFGRFAVFRLRTLPGTGLPDALILLDRFDDRLLFSDGSRQRLLAIDVLAVFGGLGRDERVPMVGDSEHDGINVFAGHHLAVIVVSLAILILVMPIDGVQR